MRVVIAGGTGFLGRALTGRLTEAGHTVTLLTRHAGAANTVEWRPDGTAGPWARVVDGADAVVNLAGEGIADRRWTAARKAALRDSRLHATRSLTAAIAAAARPPATLLSASAVGYYGPRGDEPLDEQAPPGTDFLARLCVDWEEAARAVPPATRVAIVRSGLVLHTAGGALPRMLLPFKLGVGGRLGSGRQAFPWIHRDDWVRLAVWLLDGTAAGPFNATAPGVVTNAQFTRALGRALHRPTVLPVPGVALRLALGEVADSLLTGQRAVPAHAQALGFAFRYPTIDEALQQLMTNAQ